MVGHLIISFISSRVDGAFLTLLPGEYIISYFANTPGASPHTALGFLIIPKYSLILNTPFI